MRSGMKVGVRVGIRLATYSRKRLALRRQRKSVRDGGRGQAERAQLLLATDRMAEKECGLSRDIGNKCRMDVCVHFQPGKVVVLEGKGVKSRYRAVEPACKLWGRV